jgi:uncharacterized phiE125 gp8 family phage protein
MTDTLSSKYPSETPVVSFEFADYLAAGETIASITSVACTARDGIDASASAVLASSASITDGEKDSSKVLQPTAGGLGGVSYLIVCTVLSSTGRTLVLDAILPVVALPAGIPPRPTQRWRDSCGVVWTLENTVAPTVEPVTLDEAKRWARVEHHEDDDDIQGLIAAARIEAEHQCGGRAFITSTWRLSSTQIPASIVLPVSPVRSVTSIGYVDQNGNAQTLDGASYDVDLIGAGALIVPAYNVVWPSYRYGRNALQVTFVAGFGGASAVPEPIKRWILIRVATGYRDRESVLISRDQAQPLTYVDRMLDPYRVFTA